MINLSWNILLGTLFLTSANLSLQIVATRYFSITQNYHLAFFVVSTAFLGFGVSGCFIYLKTKPSSLPSPSSLCLFSFLFSLTILVCVPILTTFSFEFYELLWAKGRLINLVLINLFLGLPFFFSGWVVASLTTIFAPSIRYLYAADLSGAALGAFLPSLVFLLHGDRGAFLAIGLIALAATLLLSLTLEKRIFFPAAALFLIVLIALFHPPRLFEFRLSPYKPLNQALQASGAKHLLTGWNAISRVDVVSSPSLKFAPGLSLAYQDPLPEQLGLFIDGGQPSALTSFSHLDQKDLSFIDYLPCSLSFLLLKNPSVLIIEPRGGLEILMALYHEAKKIKIIESNPLVISTLQGQLAAKIGHILSNPTIKAVAAFPRSAIKREKEEYDLIIFSLPDVFAATGTGLASFQEDHLRTKEAIIQLLGCLSPKGMLMATLPLLPPAREELRMLATIIECLEAIKVRPDDSLIVLLSWGTVSFIAKKSPFSQEEIDKIFNWSQERLFHLAYCPSVALKVDSLTEKSYAFPISLVSDLLNPQKRQNLYQDYLFAIQPARDNRPFFHQTIKLSRIKQTYLAFGKKWLPLLEGGGLYPLLLAQMVVINFIFLVLPLILSRNMLVLSANKYAFFSLPYFGLIGAGFMTLEILFIQKGILFLGHPTQALAIVVFSLLFSSGVGSLASSRWPRKKIFFKGWFLIICLLFIILDFSTIDYLFESFISLPFSLRMVLFFSFIFPTGFFLGFAFPAGVSRLHRISSNFIPLAWSANAFASVTASILAAILALWFGYSFLFIFAFFCYGLAFLFFYFPDHRNKTDP